MLDEEQIAKVRGTMQTQGWKEVMAPRLVQRGRQAIAELSKLPSEREEPLQGVDDAMASGYLRGRIAEIEWMLGSWENELKIHEHNRRLDELEADGRANLASPANPDLAFTRSAR